jgi:hypothetical protein
MDGTASDLLGALGQMAGERVAKSKNWPDRPRALAGRLRRAATFLRKIGIEIGFEREGRARTRIIRITTKINHPAPETEGARPSALSASSTTMPKSNSVNGFAAPSRRTVAMGADDIDASHGHTVRVNPAKIACKDAADETDAKNPVQAGWSAEDWQACLDERAGIAEFDGGLPHAQAEALAATEIEGLPKFPGDFGKNGGT